MVGCKKDFPCIKILRNVLGRGSSNGVLRKGHSTIIVLAMTNALPAPANALCATLVASRNASSLACQKVVSLPPDSMHLKYTGMQVAIPIS